MNKKINIKRILTAAAAAVLIFAAAFLGIYLKYNPIIITLPNRNTDKDFYTPSTKTLSDGKYYPSDIPGIYFEVKNSVLQLCGSYEDMLTLCKKCHTKEDDRQNAINAQGLTEEWAEPVPYEIYDIDLGRDEPETAILFHKTLDKNGRITSATGIEYTDENTIVYLDTAFYRENAEN